MNARQALSKLRALGSAQTRKTYGRHGVTGDQFGVKYGDLGKLTKAIGRDHELAVDLWESGNHDARVLATMIADPDALTLTLLRSWMRAVDNHVLSSAVASLSSRSTAGHEAMLKWMEAKGEWPAATGWMTLGNVASQPGAVSKTQARALLRTIAQRIHASPNRVKYAMNTALIALGAYVPGLEDEAVKVADRIGQVEVDHGLTNCQTPLAAPYIRKAAAHQRAKLDKTQKKTQRKTQRKTQNRASAKRSG